MAERWYAVCDRATGHVKSFGTVLTDPLAPENEAIALDAPPDFSKKCWDENLRALVALPVRTPAKTLEQKVEELGAVVERIRQKIGA